MSKIIYETAKRVEKQKKTWFRVNCFHFQIFKPFANLLIYFTVNWNKYFWIVISTFRCITLLLKLVHNIRLAQSVSLQSHYSIHNFWYLSITTKTFIVQKWVIFNVILFFVYLYLLKINITATNLDICMNKLSDTMFENPLDHARFVWISSWKD